MKDDRQSRYLGRLLSSWLALTPGEHKALMLVVGLFLLGVGLRLWLTLLA